MRVLITVQLLKYYSGSELHSYELSKRFKSKGYDVDIFTSFISESMRQHFNDIGVNVVNFEKGGGRIVQWI